MIRAPPLKDEIVREVLYHFDKLTGVPFIPHFIRLSQSDKFIYFFLSKYESNRFQTLDIKQPQGFHLNPIKDLCIH